MLTSGVGSTHWTGVGAAALGLEIPRQDKRLLAIVETDGCFADGVAAVTGCTMEHRTLWLADYGKIGATFVDVKTETAVVYCLCRPNLLQGRSIAVCRR